MDGWVESWMGQQMAKQTDGWMDKGYFEGLEIITPFMYYTFIKFITCIIW